MATLKVKKALACEEGDGTGDGDGDSVASDGDGDVVDVTLAKQRVRSALATWPPSHGLQGPGPLDVLIERRLHAMHSVAPGVTGV